MRLQVCTARPPTKAKVDDYCFIFRCTQAGFEYRLRNNRLGGWQRFQPAVHAARTRRGMGKRTGENRVFRLVINKKISAWEDEIPEGAEVGLLPPVTGG